MYNPSEASFKQVEKLLDEMLHAETDTLTWEFEDARKVAYFIRQGIFAAKKLDKPAYADLKNKWKIHEKGNKVIAKKRITLNIIPIGIHKKTFFGITTLSRMITAAVENNHLTVLHFPDLIMSIEEANQLDKWMKAAKWTYNSNSKELQKWPSSETEIKQSENP
jgi:hypothetical protein